MQRLTTLRRFSRVLLVVLVLVIGFAAGSVFVAYGASNDTYSACITSNGAIYRVRKNGSWTCLGSDTKISWNQQGPRGLNGNNGQDGADGQQGLPGESAQTNFTLRSEQISIPQNSLGGYSVDCEPGEMAIAGGFVAQSLSANFLMTGSGPVTTDGVPLGWSISVSNGSLTNATTGTISVSCLAP